MLAAHLKACPVCGAAGDQNWFYGEHYLRAPLVDSETGAEGWDYVPAFPAFCMRCKAIHLFNIAMMGMPTKTS